MTTKKDKTTPEPRTFAQALVAMQAEAQDVLKTGFNPHHKYKYMELEHVADLARDLMGRHGFAVTWGMPSQPTRNGKVVMIRLRATLWHESGTKISEDFFGEGFDAQDKAVYKAITGARKYGLLCLLGIASTDDPEKVNGSDTNGAAPKREDTETDRWAAAFNWATEKMGTDPTKAAEELRRQRGDHVRAAGALWMEDAEVFVGKTRKEFAEAIEAMAALKAEREAADAAQEAMTA